MAGWHGVDTVTADTVEAVVSQTRRRTVEPDRTATSAVPVGGRDIPLATFLRRCADAIESVQPDRPAPAQHGVDEAAFAATRDAFIAAGLAALDPAGTRYGWVQLNLRLAGWPPPADLYAGLRDTMQESLGEARVRNASFMHKPPGIRLRFEVPAGDRQRFRAWLLPRVESWCAAGLVISVEHGVYEPEALLFGGPVSMTHVHRLFTHDALTWLEHHAGPAVGVPDPAWGLSLLMLRPLYSALGIDGWEDLGVWDWLCRRGGRRLAPSAVPAGDLENALAAVRTAWRRPFQLRAQLSPRAGDLAKRYERSIKPDCARWREEYLGGGHAVVGPRQTAALLTIFHWNRAGLSDARQSLLTHALMGQVSDAD
jgi:thiopeptide-type bacteriocin biosynthesis protein